MTSSLTTSPDEPADHARAGSSCRPWPDQGEGCRIGCGRAWTAFGPGRETFSTFRLHFSHPSLDARLEPENGIGPVLTTPSHIRELSRLFRRRHAVRLYGSHLRPVRSARCV